MTGASKHLDTAQIWKLLESESAPREARDHLAGCPDCRNLFEDRQGLLDLLGSARLPKLDESLIEAAMERLSLAPAQTAVAGETREPGLIQQLRAGLRSLAAHLAADSAALAGAARSGATVYPRTLLYESDSVSISLLLSEDAGNWSVDGQLIPHPGNPLPGDARVVLYEGDDCNEAPVSTVGEFSFRDVRPAAWRVAAAVGPDLIVTDPLRYSA